jgi:methionyl-tRNA synthetase
VHVIGKDISRFHTVYWPAMLMSLELPLPRRVFAHGYITIKGARLSKSSGNIVTPDEVMAVTGPDPFRYYLLAENDFAQDGNFDMDALVLKCNADLANDWGNLVNRTINMTRKYFPGEELAAPARPTHSVEVKASFDALRGELESALDRLDTQAYARAATARSRVLNLYIDRTKPWSLAKAGTPEAMAELREVLWTLLEGIRWIATALMPVLPFRMPEVFRQLDQPAPAELGGLRDLTWGETRFQPGEPKPIYPRIELAKPDAAAGAGA